MRQIIERDSELKEKAPEVLKEQAEKRTEALSIPAENNATTFDNLLAVGQLEAVAHGGEANDITPEMIGHKFPLPELPLPPFSNRKERYDPVVDQVTNLMMKHGRLSAAQRV